MKLFFLLLITMCLCSGCGNKYENMLRGFYIDIHKEVPGPLLFTTEEVIDSIENIESVKKEYREKYDEFYERFCSIDDGNASKRIVEKVWIKNITN